MRSAVALVCLLISTAEADERCATPTAVTAVSNPQDGPSIHANTTYAVAGFAAGKKNYLVYQVPTAGEYKLALGGAAIGVRVIDQPPVEIRGSKDCMHTKAMYLFEAGDRIVIELGAIPAGQNVLLRLDAPDEEEHVAVFDQRDAAMSRDVCSVHPADALTHVSSWRPRVGESV